MIQTCDLREQYLQLKDELDAAMQEVAAGGQYILGPQVKAFEREIAGYCGCAYGVGVNSGTDALYLALRALRIGPGDEVITTPFTFIATAEAISLADAVPVFVDIDPATLNIDPALIEAAVTPRTRAILPVHLYGHPCDMDAIRAVACRHNLRIVEDCAQAFGATYRGRSVGALGDVGCISFFPSKNLGAFGDGGMVVTNDPEIADRVEMLRRHGGKVKYHHSEMGMNSRLDELQAAILRVKLRYLERWISARRRIAYTYNARLAGIPGLRLPMECIDNELRTPTRATIFPMELLRVAYHQYTVLVDARDAVQEALKAAGIGSMIYYPVPLHLQEAYADLGHARGAFPQAEAAADRCLSLPIYPEMTYEQQEQVITAVQAVLSAAQPIRA